MLHVNYLITPAVFFILFLDHLAIKMKVAANSKCDVQKLSELVVEIKNQL